jgi:RimJ/RimL family protein N-acetyltransferase
MIKTDRLLIDLPSPSDMEDMRALHNNPEILKWLTDTRLVSKKQQNFWFAQLQKSKSSQRYTVKLIDSYQLVGVFRVDNIDYENNSVYVGLDISPLSQRKGLATEVYVAMIKYLFLEVNMNRLTLITLANNYAAISLYEKLGFIREGTLREAYFRGGNYVDGYFYSLLKKDVKF